MFYSKSLVGSKSSHVQSKGSSHSGSASSLCSPSKYGCFKHYFTVYLFSGLNTSIFPSKFRATGLAFGYSYDHGCLFLFGSFLIYFLARSFPIKAISSLFGVPSTAIVLFI
jgi:hypothetical protein